MGREKFEHLDIAEEIEARRRRLRPTEEVLNIRAKHRPTNVNTMLSDYIYFTNTPRHRGHDLAVWFLSHAFKQNECQAEKFKQLIRDTQSAHPGFMSSPVIGLTLFRSIQMSRKNTILSLLSEGGDVNMMFRGRSMLHEAVRVSSETMLAFLLTLPNIRKDQYDVECKTSLMDAARGRPRCLRMLLEAGCSMTLTDADGNNALHQTFQAHRAHKDDILACLDILLEFGADINSRGSQGKTCLLKAVEMRSHWLVKWLILHNCDLNLHSMVYQLPLYLPHAIKTFSDVPLIIAFQKADRVIVEVLIASGCEFREYSWLLHQCRPYKPLYKSMADALARVDSLQSQCRKVIRKCLTTNILSESKQLCLPVSLQQFVLCVEELRSLDKRSYF